MKLMIETGGEIQPEEVRRIAALIEEGFVQGEVVDAEGNRAGWWELS